MRTKNKKWTVPILVIVPVLALAAFLAVGLLTANSAKALDDDECGFVIAENTGAITTTRGTTDLSDTAPCYALGDSIDIIIENNNNEDNTDADLSVNVYVSGGSDYSKVQMAAEGDYEGAVGVSEIKLEVPQPDRRKEPGEAMLTVTRSMGKTTGVVLVSIYDDSTDFTQLKDLDSNSEALPDSGQSTIDGTMVIVFLGKPSLTQADGDDDGDELDKSSSLTAFNLATPTGDNLADPQDSEVVSAILSDTVSIYIFAEVRDDQGRALVGGDDVESTVTFNVEFAAGSDLKTGRALTTSETEDVGTDGRADIELDGWKTGDGDEVGPVKVTVTAMYTGPTGDLDLGKVVLSRAGEAETIVGSVFSRACLVDTDSINDASETDADRYDDDKLDVTDEENKACMMDFRYGTDQMFIVKAHVEDGLGSVIMGTLSVEVEDVDNPIATANPVDLHGVADVGDDTSAWLYTVDSKAELADHMITVSDDDDDNDVIDLVFTVAVAGPPYSYMIDGPERIDLGRSGTFMVQAYDKNMSIPHFDDGMPMVEVFIQGLASGNTRYITNGMIDIDPDTGMGEFIVYAPNSAMDADVIRIFVSTGDMEQLHEVTFGDPDATPDPMERDGFTADYTVDATSTAGSGMVDVNWTRSEELNLSLVSLIQGGEVVDFTITLGISAQFSGVEPGEYDVSVFSFRNNADGKDGEIAFGTVTVE